MRDRWLLLATASWVLPAWLRQLKSTCCKALLNAIVSFILMNILKSSRKSEFGNFFFRKGCKIKKEKCVRTSPGLNYCRLSNNRIKVYSYRKERSSSTAQSKRKFILLNEILQCFINVKFSKQYEIEFKCTAPWRGNLNGKFLPNWFPTALFFGDEAFCLGELFC